MKVNLGDKNNNKQENHYSPLPTPHPLIIEIRNISKKYHGSNKKANNNISLQIKKGEILCIAGENGAGKTTLMKILAGLEKPDSGEIINKNTKIGMVHQHFMLFPEYTVAQNITIKDPPRKMGLFLDNKKANEYAQRIIEVNNFSINSTQRVKDLSLGQMQQVEICRVLFQNADLIILDEPTAILTEEETQSLFNTMRQLVKDGKTIIFITHKMQEIKQISDRVVILNQGELKEEFTHGLEGGRMPTSKINFLSNDERSKSLARIFTDEENIKNNNSRSFASFDANIKIIEFQNVTVKRKGQQLPLLDNVSFSVHAGEILGFTGTGGNGLGVIEAVLGGFLHPVQGRVLHNGKDISKFNIRRLRKNGLAFVPADRKLYGSAQGATIEENLIINCRDNLYKNGFINKKEAREFSQKLLQEYSIQGDLNANAYTLSGGNLQKLILAREIYALNDYIVFSEPTWGLDIQAKTIIMNEIIKLRDKGAAVILISTNAEEVLALADRVIVMNKGRILPTKDTSNLRFANTKVGI